jgi:hypothetical protein
LQKNAILRGVTLSFQITVFKVLAGYPRGRASLADLRRTIPFSLRPAEQMIG